MKKQILFILSLLLFCTSIAQNNDYSFSKFTDFSNGKVDLTKNEYLIGVFNTNCDHCQETAIKLNKLTNTKIPSLYALFYNEIEEIGPKEFNKITNTNYSYIVIGDEDFWSLIKNSPPIIYYIKNGKIATYFEGDNIAEEINKTFQ